MTHDSSCASRGTPQTDGTRVYKIRKSVLIGGRAIAAFLALAAVGVLFLRAPQQEPLVVFLSVAAGAIGLFGLVIHEVFYARRRLTISETEVEYRTATGVRRLSLAGIKGFRSGDARRPGLILEPKEAGQRALDLPLYLGKPGEIEAWARHRFPDLDAIDTKANEQQRRADLEQILADDAYGFTREERQGFYVRQQGVFKVLVGFSAAGMFLGFIPRQMEWVIALQFLALVAALASGVLGRGFMTLWGLAGPAHPIVGVPIFLSGLGLACQSFFGFGIESWSPVVAPMGVLTLVWTALLLLCFRDARKPFVGIGATLVLALLLASGSVLQYNGLFDRGQPVVHKVAVLEKIEVRGKSKSWNVVLQPWGTRTKPVKEDVEPDLLRAVEPGDTLWVLVRPGALNVPWYVVTLPQPK